MIDKETGLTDKEKTFVGEYLTNNFNGAKAAIKAGYSVKCAKEASYKLLTKDHVRQFIKAQIDEIMKGYKETLEYKIIKTYQILAFYDPEDFLTKDGKLKKELCEYGEQSIVVKGIQTSYNSKGLKTTKVVLSDREDALEKLSQYMGMLHYNADLNIKGADIIIKLPDDLKSEE